MIIIELNEIEFHLALNIAISRQRGKPEKREFGTMNHLLINIYGALGEVAFGKAINRMPDTTVKQFDDGFDFKIKDVTFDVKTRANQTNPDLLITEIKRANKEYCQYYILANVRNETPNKVELIGWINKEYLKKLTPVSLNGTSTFIIENYNLMKIEPLIKNILQF
jgi:hypothetical protein